MLSKWLRRRRQFKAARASGLILNGQGLIRIPSPSREDCARAFWQWVTLMSQDDYGRALEALYWPGEMPYTPASLKDQVTTFFGGTKPWSVVVPNGPVIGEITGKIEYDAQGARWLGASAWFLALVPLTNEPADPKDDALPLMGLAASFLVWQRRGSYVLQHESFHV